MKFNRNRSRAFSWFLALTLALCAALSASPAALADDFDYSKAWTTVGSAGTVDEAGARQLVFHGSGRPLPGNLPPPPPAPAGDEGEFGPPPPNTHPRIP